MFSMPRWLDLSPLDRDTDILRYRGHFIDFHPRIRHPYPRNRLVIEERCELDREVVREKEVNRLVDTLDERQRAELHRISKLPRRMTGTFLEMYEGALRWLEAQIEAWEAEIEALRGQNDYPGRWERIQYLRSMIRWAESEIRRIEPYIEPLRTFQERIHDIEEELKEEFERIAS
jgi:hypothetical protein